MKSLPIAIVMLLSMGLAANTAWSDVTLTDDFTNANLVFQTATTTIETYAFTAPAFSEGTQDATVTRPLLKTGPSIVASGPLGQAWVFSTGSSNKFRDVHWGHYVYLTYRFEDLLEGGAVSFKYLNTRACGGRVDVLFAQHDESGNRIWEARQPLEDWETWPGPYSRPRGQISQRTWRSYMLSADQVKGILQGRKYNTVIIREFDITSEAGSGFFDDIQITAVASQEEKCEFPKDTLPPAGAIHAHSNLIWPPNNKMVPVELSGYVRDELSMARDKSGNGISSAYILINGSQKIILKDGSTNLLDAEGFFKIVYKFRAVKKAMYSIELYAADTNPDGPKEEDLIDSTYVRVPANMSPAP
jgi:hypothetical protein